MVVRLTKAFRDLFRLSWVAKVAGTSVGCEVCRATGRYDPLYGVSVAPGDETVRTIDCPECTGLGYHFIPEE